MMKNKWTPEPWRTQQGQADHRLYVLAGPETVPFTGITIVMPSLCAETDANAIRITDCVNACQGMQNPVKDIADLKAEVKKLTAWLRDCRLEIKELER